MRTDLVPEAMSYANENLYQLLIRKCASPEAAESLLRETGLRFGIPGSELRPTLAALALVSLGVSSETVSRMLPWGDFESFCADIAIAQGYQVKKNVTLRNPRVQIDFVARSESVIASMDCKHWSRLGPSAVRGEILRYLIEKNHEIAAVIDNDPAKTGRTVREIVGLESEVRVHRSVEEVEIDKLDVVVFATKSRLSEVAHEIEYVVMQGVDAVTTCEELAYPYYASQALASRLDSTAKEKGVTVVGVGVNHGYVMDWLPWVVASASYHPSSIHAVESV